MYEVTYVLDGVMKKININANDSMQATQIFTNMFSGCGMQIINVRRI